MEGLNRAVPPNMGVIFQDTLPCLSETADSRKCPISEGSFKPSKDCVFPPAASPGLRMPPRRLKNATSGFQPKIQK